MSNITYIKKIYNRLINLNFFLKILYIFLINIDRKLIFIKINFILIFHIL